MDSVSENLNGEDIVEIIEDVEPNKKKRKTRSAVYNGFDLEEDGESYKCKLCPVKYKLPSSGSNGALGKHLKSKHPFASDGYEPGRTESSSLMQFLSKGQTNLQEPKPKEKITNAAFRRHLVKLTVRTVQPFSFVENKTFREFVGFVGNGHPELTMPCRKTLMRDFVEMYDEERKRLKEAIKSQDSKVSLIIDGWTSSNQHSFLGIIAQWISKDWEIIRVPLDLAIMEGTHSGKNISEAVGRILSEFELWDKVAGITTDNASNMDTFFEEMDSAMAQHGIEFNSKERRVRCLAHILNLTTKAIMNATAVKECDLVTNVGADANEGVSLDFNEDEKKISKLLKSVEERKTTIGKLRQSIVAIRASPQRHQRFKSQCEAIGISHKELILDVPVRWNTSLAMMDRARDLRGALECTIGTLPELLAYKLDESDWDWMDLLIKILEPIGTFTKTLSSGSIPTISKCASVYQSLFDHLDSFIEATAASTSRGSRNQSPGYPIWIQNAAKAGMAKLRKYYPSTDGLVYVAGTILDPRKKTAWFKALNWKKDWIDNNVRTFKNEWKRGYKPKESNPQTKDPDVSMGFEASLLLKQMSGFFASSEEDEVTSYLKEKPICAALLDAKFGGILGWWKAHEQQFPHLSRMAKDTLCVSGTGVPCEQFFSGAPDLLTNRRQRLMETTINQQMCLNAWLAARDKEARLSAGDLFLKCVESKAYGFEN